MPSTMHLVAPEDKLYSSLEDVRLFIDELGPHDAQVLCFNYSVAGKLYNHLSLLLSQAAEQEVFEPLQEWLLNSFNQMMVSHVDHSAVSYNSSGDASLDAEPAIEPDLAFA